MNPAGFLVLAHVYFIACAALFRILELILGSQVLIQLHSSFCRELMCIAVSRGVVLSFV